RPELTLFPYTTLFRSGCGQGFPDYSSLQCLDNSAHAVGQSWTGCRPRQRCIPEVHRTMPRCPVNQTIQMILRPFQTVASFLKTGDRKSTRLNSSHVKI